MATNAISTPTADSPACDRGDILSLVALSRRNAIEVLYTAIGASCCTQCGSRSHRAVECRRASSPRCLLCNDPDHHTLQCFDTPSCTRCGDVGHAVDDCRTRICERCGYRGHTGETCKTRCVLCGATGEHCSFYCNVPPPIPHFDSADYDDANDVNDVNDTVANCYCGAGADGGCGNRCL